MSSAESRSCHRRPRRDAARPPRTGRRAAHAELPGLLAARVDRDVRWEVRSGRWGESPLAATGARTRCSTTSPGGGRMRVGPRGLPDRPAPARPAGAAGCALLGAAPGRWSSRCPRSASASCARGVPRSPVWSRPATADAFRRPMLTSRRRGWWQAGSRPSAGWSTTRPTTAKSASSRPAADRPAAPGRPAWSGRTGPAARCWGCPSCWWARSARRRSRWPRTPSGRWAMPSTACG